MDDTSAEACRSTLVKRMIGSSITRNHASTGGFGRVKPELAPRTARSMEMLKTRAPSGKSMPRKKMSLQPLWVRSMRTGVTS
jgi:hypothetical protein